MLWSVAAMQGKLPTAQDGQNAEKLQDQADDSQKILIGLLLLALAAGIVLFVTAVVFGVASD